MILSRAQFSSFRSANRSGLKERDAFRIAGPELGEIIKISPYRKWRARIRSFSGSVYDNVRLPGPAFSSEGNMHGMAAPFEVGNLVLLNYLRFRGDSPIVMAVFPFAGGDQSKYNLQKSGAWKPSEPTIGHKTGHRMAFQDDKIVYYDKNGDERIVFDFDNDEIIFYGFDVKVRDANDTDGALIGSDGEVVAKADSTNVTLTTHIHPTGVGPSGAPTPGT